MRPILPAYQWELTLWTRCSTQRGLDHMRWQHGLLHSKQAHRWPSTRSTSSSICDMSTKAAACCCAATLACNSNASCKRISPSDYVLVKLSPCRGEAKTSDRQQTS